MAFQSGASSSSLPSSSPPIRSCNHNVFLSFRGKDVRSNFISHLHKALVQKGINTYIDNNLKRGEEISPALFKAIEESMISIIVLSENYAGSRWCLDELLKILDCKETKKQIVLPIFFQVDPSEVRHQNGKFGKSFDTLGDKIKDNAKMLKWKEALKKVAHISGFSSAKFGNESECTEKIVQEVSSKLPNRPCLDVAKYPVGLESRVKDINMLLRIEIINETRMIGIFGTGGIGKTTIAKAVYNQIANEFEGSCYLANVRENSKPNRGGLVKLQKKILSDILRDPKVEIDDDARGINLIQDKLCCKKVLLVLDDIDCLDQLEKLSGRSDWFGLGSRIIITTRDEGLLTKHLVHFKFRMKEMVRDEALQLFSKHAFKSDKPDYAFADLTEDALHYAGGLPLALQVIGSNLYGEDIRFWKSELEKYKSIQEENIHKKLKISYDGLDDPTKKIFLDIACFFKGHERENVTKILDSCGFFAYAGIKMLNDKCLITIDELDRLMMHDLLEDMGKEIVRQESPEKPDKRSRLWFHKDVREVLEKNKGTEQIEGIMINLPWRDDTIHLGSEVFTKLRNLRIFINRNANFSGGLNYLSDELRVLDWYKCPLEILPSSLHGEKLTVLKMQGSMFRDLGTGLQSKNLTSIDLSESKYLTKISDLSSCSNLEKLILNDCERLVEVHDSVGLLNKLVELNFVECSSLKNLPRNFKLQSLELLELRGCTSLESFPEIECKMEHLKHLYLESTVIKKLPSSITYLIGLEQFVLRWCESLEYLPINIFQLERLMKVHIQDCPNFVNFGEEVGQNGQSMPCTQELLPWLAPKSNFSLCTLIISGSGIVSLPPWIEGLVGLSHLDLAGCEQLEEILQLPPNIEVINAPRCIRLVKVHHSVGFLDKLVELILKGCSSLKNLPRSFMLPSLKVLELEGCKSLEYFPEIKCEMEHLKCVRLHSIAIQKLPSSITNLTGLEELYLRGCESLEYLSINIFQLERLMKVYIQDCPNFVNFGKEVGQNGQSIPCTQKNEMSSSKELFPLPPPESNNLSQIYNFSSNLRKLSLSGSGIVSLPPCIEGFVGLSELDLRDCKQLEEILHLPPNIEEVEAFGCGLLERFRHASFGIPDLKRLTKVDLSECNKVEVDVGNHAPDPLLVQKHFREKESSTIIYPESRIPKWCDDYCKETTSYTNSIEVEINHNAFTHPIVAFVLCFVARHLPVTTSYITISINGQQIRNDMRLRPSMDTHCVCLQYIAGNQVRQMLSSYRKGNNIRFTFGSYLKEAIFKSAGVHLIYISGFSSAKFRNESECTKKIVQEVSSQLPNRPCLQSGASSSSLPSSSPPIRSCNHDVFLSFRGEDVRSNFISHLHKALVQKGINTYIDDNLQRGEEISPALFKAIEESMISIIVLSENYAGSRWCLDELLKILDCKETKKQFVLPIFFQVDPSEVRHQNGKFGKSFDTLGDKIKDNAKMLKWKEALKKVLSLKGSSGFSSAKFGCYKMFGHLNDYFGGIIFPGSMIPDWLIHCKEASNTQSCEIDIDGLLYWGEIIGIAVYAAVGPIFAISTKTPLHLLNVDITCNSVRKLCKERILHSWGLDHEWLEYSILEPFQLKGKSLNVKFTYYSNSLSLKRCGVQLVHKHADNAKDHSNVFYEHDCNLESDYYPQQKRRSTTLDIKNLNLGYTTRIAQHATICSEIDYLVLANFT